MAGWAGEYRGLTKLSWAPVLPTFRQAPGNTQEVVVVQARDQVTLNCEVDSVPEPAVTWYKDGQPLALLPRLQVPPSGQRLEILDTQVSS